MNFLDVWALYFEVKPTILFVALIAIPLAAIAVILWSASERIKGN
jgi:hypothetical protein